MAVPLWCVERESAAVTAKVGKGEACACYGVESKRVLASFAGLAVPTRTPLPGCIAVPTPIISTLRSPTLPLSAAFNRHQFVLGLHGLAFTVVIRAGLHEAVLR
jgi:hypothetical protein